MNHDEVRDERLDRIEAHLKNLKLNDEKQGELLIDIRTSLIGSPMNGNKGVVFKVDDIDNRLIKLEQKQALVDENLGRIKWMWRTVGGSIIAFFLWFFTNKHN